MQIILTTSGLVSFAIFSHYIFLFAPGIFIAVIFAFDAIVRRQSGVALWFLNKYANFCILVFIICIIYFSFFLSPAFTGLAKDYPQDNAVIEKSLIEKFTPEDSLAVSAQFAPLLSNRSSLYLMLYSYLGRTQFAKLPWQLPPVDYILIDWSDFMSDLNRALEYEEFAEYKKEIAENWQKTMSDYNLFRVQDNYYLLSNQHNGLGENVPWLEIVPATQDSDVSWQAFLTPQNDYQQLVLEFRKTLPQDKKYLIRFYKQDNTYFDLPLDYGMLPMEMWSEQQWYRFFYYVNKDVVGYQIISWDQLKNMLGEVNQAVIRYQTESFSERRNFDSLTEPDDDFFVSKK